MEAEEAGRAVRTVHEAAAHALEQLEGIDNLRAEADARLALLGGVIDEFSASMRSVLPVWAEMASGGFRCSYPGDPEHLWVSLGAFLALNEDRAGTLVDKRFRIWDLMGCLERGNLPSRLPNSIRPFRSLTPAPVRVPIRRSIRPSRILTPAPVRVPVRRG
jgi:hypothetical protein